MSYIREITVKGHTYCQLVESYRENGTVKRRVLRHLGKRFIGKHMRLNRKVKQAEEAIDYATKQREWEREGFHLEYVWTPNDTSSWTPEMVVEALNNGEAEIDRNSEHKGMGGGYWVMPLKQMTADNQPQDSEKCLFPTPDKGDSQ